MANWVKKPLNVGECIVKMHASMVATGSVGPLLHTTWLPVHALVTTAVHAWNRKGDMLGRTFFRQGTFKGYLWYYLWYYGTIGYLWYYGTIGYLWYYGTVGGQSLDNSMLSLFGGRILRTYPRSGWPGGSFNTKEPTQWGLWSEDEAVSAVLQIMPDVQRST